MKILSVEWKNFNGYGNIPQKIDFQKNGKLYLLVGQNGAGKSSIAEAIIYGLYGKLEGKRLGDIANRINGGMELTLQLKCKGKNVTIKRGIKPGYFELFIDGKQYDQAGNKNVQEYLETELLDIPYQVFKNIIILSVNDFKSFLTMSSGDKRNIVDRLFGFTIINDMRESIREQKRDVKASIKTLFDELNILEESIISINEKIGMLKKEKKVDQKKLIEDYEDKINQINKDHTNKKEVLQKIINKYNEFKGIVNEKTKEEQGLISSLKEYKSKIDLFNNDCCPTCGTSFDNKEHKHLKEQFISDVKVKKGDLVSVRGDLSKANKVVTEAEKMEKTCKDNIVRMETLLSTYQYELDGLISKSEKKDFQYLKQLIQENNSKTKTKQKEKHKSELDEKFLEVIENILGEEGVKNLALKTILPPLNASIDSMVKQMHIPHRIRFDEKFDCKITSLGEEINPKTMSTGERKKTDFIIIIAMIKLLKVRYPSVNILFLDEIFSSIDGAGIHEIISILKDTVEETDLNTWVINHSELPVNLFDIKVEAYKEGGYSKLDFETIT